MLLANYICSLKFFKNFSRQNTLKAQKHYIFTLLLFALVCKSSWGQIHITDSTNIYEWTVNTAYNERKQVPMDTLLSLFHVYNPIFKESIGNTYNGTLGSPYQSQLYFSRDYQSEFIFLHPYNAYLSYPNEFHFVNTKMPYTNLSYEKGGPGNYKEEFYRVRHTQNINKRLNFDFQLQQYFSNGRYQSQATSHKNYNIAGNYLGERYKLHILAFKNSLNNYENGGISNDLYITDPEKTGDAVSQVDQIPTNIIDAKTKINNQVFYLGHTYDFNIRLKAVNDSTPGEVIPFATIGHTFMYEENDRTHRDDNSNYYMDDSIGYGLTPSMDPQTVDIVEYNSLSNTFSINFNEKVNRWARFGMAGYLQHKLQYYSIPQKNTTSPYNLEKHMQTHLILGGKIYKQAGEHFTYDANIAFYFQGDNAGDLELSGNIYNTFTLFNKELNFNVQGRFLNQSPDLLYQNFNSNYFQWTNDFSKIQRSTLQASLSCTALNNLKLYSSLENVSNYIFWGEDARPAQYDAQLQVFQLGMELNFRLGNFHSNNHLVFQQSSAKEVLDLPQLTSYSNLFYSNLLFKVMRFQIGVEARYFSEYYAPGYMPLLGQFHNQREAKTGNFPLVSPFLSFHLKRFRFFIKRYNFGEGFGSPNYFTAPHYPLNPTMFSYGLSWNFYT